MQFQQFLNLAENYSAIPVYRRLMADILTPVSLYLKVREGARYPFLLESVEGGEQLARYSFIGRDPYQVLRYENGRVILEYPDQSGREVEDDYFSVLKTLTTMYD